MAPRTETSVDTFDEREVGYLQSIVRMELRRQEKKLVHLYQRFGDATDPTGPQQKIAMCEEMYRKLGGDPENITYGEPDE